MARRVPASKFGTGNVFQVKVLENRRSDLILPPTLCCQVINMEEDISPNTSPSSSGAMKLALPLITSGPNLAAVQYLRSFPTLIGMQRYGSLVLLLFGRIKRGG